MAVTLVLCLLGLVSPSVAQGLAVGNCKKVTAENNEHFLDKLANENYGSWSYKMIPKTIENQDIQWMTLKVTAANPEEGYFLNTTWLIKDYENTIYYVEHVYQDSSGQLISKISFGDETITLKMFVLKYKEGEYAYLYKCVDTGGDPKLDLSYVLAHGALSKKQQVEVGNLKTGFGFIGSLMYIEESGPSS